MNILIVYATKGGVSRRCAEMLAGLLAEKHAVTCLNIEENPPSPGGFDVAVVGGSVRMGRWNKKLRHYVKNHKETLENMPSAAFFCCGFPDEFEDYAETQLPKNMRFSLGVHCFGGELKPEKLRGFDKLVIKMVRSHIRTRDFEEGEYHSYTLPEIIPEHISLLADKIRALTVKS